MPKIIRSKEEFQKLLPSAREIRVVRKDENAKIKLRTDRVLYTFQTSADEVEALTKGVKTPLVEY